MSARSCSSDRAREAQRGREKEATRGKGGRKKFSARNLISPAERELLNKARLADYKPSWCALLLTKLNRLSFPSLTQGADKLTEGKRLAGILSIMRHNAADCLCLTGKVKVNVPVKPGERYGRTFLESADKLNRICVSAEARHPAQAGSG